MAKEYTLIGGNGTVVSPLMVTENGTYTAGDSKAFNPVIVNVEGGGSAYREATLTITNTKVGSHITYNYAVTVQNGETAVAEGDIAGDSTPHSITLLLGPSGTSIYIDAATVTSLDGDIEAVPETLLYRITGDASFSGEGFIDY